MLCWCWGLRSGAAEAMKQGLSFEMWLLCPAGTGAYPLFRFGRLRDEAEGIMQLVLQRE